MKTEAAKLRFDAIEGLRAILALWVLFSHVILATGWTGADLYWPFNVIRAGGLAVVGFMVVSGFAISHLVITGQEPYRQYIWRRWLRLFPLMAVIICVGVAMHTLWPYVLRYDDRYTVQYLIAHATMLHGMIPTQILPESATSIVGPAWSISLEWQFYLVAPFIILPIARGKYAIATLMLLAFIFTRKATWHLFGYELTFDEGAFLPVRIFYFLLGIASYLAVTRIGHLPMSASLGAFVVMLVFIATRDYPISVWAFALMGIFGVKAFDSMLSGPTLRYLGKISFSIYLVHGLFVVGLRYAMIELGMEPQTLTFAVVLSALTLAGTIFVSHFTYLWIELPFINYGKYGRLTKPQPISQLVPSE